MDKGHDELFKALGAVHEHPSGNDVSFWLNRGPVLVCELEDDGKEFRRKICDG